MARIGFDQLPKSIQNQYVPAKIFQIDIWDQPIDKILIKRTNKYGVQVEDRWERRDIRWVQVQRERILEE